MDRLNAAGLVPDHGLWLKPRWVKDIKIKGDLDTARRALAPLEDQIDIIVQPEDHRRKMLLVSDMDSTMITVECIDELADYAGIKPEIAAITNRAMAGELDFTEALKARVALLEGLDEGVIAECLHNRVRPMPGAVQLVQTMAAWGAHSVMVSGGFTSFAEPIAEQIGLSEAHANVLEIKDGKLTGKLVGKIIDAIAKRVVLDTAVASRGLSMQQALVVGDGANDLPMIAAAVCGQGLGTAYHPRPLLAEASNFAVRHGDLTALLYAQGVAQQDWASA
ncbi:MAG: hypothetical protein RL481_1168 [Pseudomonadota bacterium]|jgi:phosphoserine phosphatase